MVLVVGSDGRVSDVVLPPSTSRKVLVLHQGRIREALVDTGGGGGGAVGPTFVLAETQRHADVGRLAPVLAEPQTRREVLRTSPTLGETGRRSDAARIPTGTLTPSETQALADRVALAQLRLTETPAHRDAATIRVRLTTPGTVQFRPSTSTLTVEGWGSAGGGGPANVAAGGGGGGGGYSRSTLADLVVGQAYAVVIPPGGAIGTNGSDFTFAGNRVVAKGGLAGGAGAATARGAGGTGGQASAGTGTTRFSGGTGGGGGGLNVAPGAGGGGAGDAANGGNATGENPPGAGGTEGGGIGGQTAANPATTPAQPGGGGAGASTTSAAQAGAPGMARLTFTV